MPGLFGCLALNAGRRLDPGLLDRVHDRMSSRLRHLDSYLTERQDAPDGRWTLGRIGHERLMPAERNYEAEGRTSKARGYGVFLDPIDSPADRPAPISDALYRVADEPGYYSAFCTEESGDRIALVADRRASEPVFYAVADGVLYFAPEVKALLDLDFDPGGLDPEALAALLGWGFLLPHQSLFTGVRKLTSRHALVIEAGAAREIEYWKYEPGVLADSKSRDPLPEMLADLVRKSILRDFGAAEDTITFLSGGLDSRYILACLTEAHPDQAAAMHAVTWAEREDIPQSDGVVAAQVARRLGIRHQFIERRDDEYEKWFRETSYLLDGHTEVAAAHPHEFEIMKTLHGQGFGRVIRGDETFGLRGMIYSLEASMVNINIRPFSGINLLGDVMRPDWYARTCEAGDARIEILKTEGTGLDPVDFKDICYFQQRVPTYLSSAAYLKQVLFDHRNPLLANEILDFYRRVPINLRLDKKLFFQTFGVAHPDLARMPYAATPGTEDWEAIMVHDTPLRRMIQKELAETDSGIWEVFDRQKVIGWFDSLSVGGTTAAVPLWKRPLRLARDCAAHLMPRRVAEVAQQRASAKLRVHHLMFRILVLKYWFDTFYRK